MGLRLALFAAVELARLVHRHRLLTLRANVDLAFDQADSLALAAGFTPQVGAADAGGDGRDADADFAPPHLREQIGGEAERALGDAHRRLEQSAAVRIHLADRERAVLAQLDEAALVELDQGNANRRRFSPRRRLEFHADRERPAHAGSLHPGGHLQRLPPPRAACAIASWENAASAAANKAAPRRFIENPPL